MATAEDWAGRIADRLLAGQPAMKAAGGSLRREQLVKAIRPACAPLAELECELARQRARLEALMQADWRPDGLVSGPYTEGRFQRFDATHWTTRLTPATEGDSPWQ